MLRSQIANDSGVIAWAMADWRCHPIGRALLMSLQPIRRTGPDLDLVKQVEQVTALVLEGPARRFARIGSIEITGRSDLLISQLWAWLILRCKKQPKQPGAAEGEPFAKGSPATGPLGHSARGARLAAEAV